VGSALTLLALALMNGELIPPEKPDAPTVVSFDVPPPKPPPKRPKPRAKPKPKRTTQAPPPIPTLAAGLGGLDFGLPSFAGSMDDATSALLGDVGDVVMTEDAVDDPPRPTTRVAPTYPVRARAKNITGYVTLSLLVGSDGSVRDVRVLEAEPPGVFESAALEALQGWAFEPATYEGRAVSVRARQTLRFELE
jgi:protein TonB